VCGRRVWLRQPRYPFSIQFPGKRIGDVAFGIGGVPIVSERFVRAWKEAGLLGLVFSSGPLDCRASSASVFDSGSSVFFAAYPEPELLCLSPEAGAKFEAKSECPCCCSSEVVSLRRVRFSQDRELPDFFMPSCLSGWFAVSDRAAELIARNRLVNFRFVTSFARAAGRELVREYASLR
jgi:hypothetical protein